MITSATVAARTIAKLCPASKVLVAGDVGLWEALQAQELQLLDSAHAELGKSASAEIVLMGKDPPL